MNKVNTTMKYFYFVSAMSQYQSEYDSNERNDTINSSDNKSEHEMNVDQSKGYESPDKKILDSINWYINSKNAEKSSIITDYNNLGQRFEKERSDNNNLKEMLAGKDRKIGQLIEENTQLKVKAKEVTGREEELRQQFMAEMKKTCIRCASKSKWQYHSLPFCSNKCYSEMAALFRK